jgi:hypothetical protein
LVIFATSKSRTHLIQTIGGMTHEQSEKIRSEH